MFNTSNLKNLKSQSGMALPMALVLMVVASLLVVPAILATSTMVKVNQELESSTVAYYAAKAGIEDACWTFKTASSTGVPVITDLPDKINGMTVERSSVLVGTPVVSYTENSSVRVVDDYYVTADNVTVTTESYYVDNTTTTTGTYLVTSVAKLGGENKAQVFTSVDVTTVKTERTHVTQIITYTPGTAGTPATPGTPGTNGYPFDYAVATTGGLLWIKNNANVNSLPSNGVANVFSNGQLRKDTATGFINGKGYYTEGTSICTNITGGCEKVTEGITFQTCNQTWYWDQARLGKAYPTPSDWPNTALPTTYGTNTYIYDGEKNAIKLDGTSNWTNIGTVKNPTYLGGAGNISYINGNLKLEKNFVVKGVVWVNGTISIEGLTRIYTDPSKQSYLLAHGGAVDNHGILLVTNSKIMATNNNLNLMSDNGFITLESGIDGPTIESPVLIGILYAPNGTITINSNSDAVTSAILGKSVILDANVIVNYDTALRDNPPEGFELNTVPTPGTPGTTGTEPKQEFVTIYDDPSLLGDPVVTVIIKEYGG